MPESATPRVTLGLPQALRKEAALLFWQAFSREILPIPVTESRGVALIENLLRAEKILVSCDAQGGLAAMAGLRDATGGLIACDPAPACAEVWGPWRGSIAAWAMRLHRSGPATSDMVLDGLVVSPRHRGQGHGRALIAQAAERAAARGYPGLRAEVASGNHAALALYRGFGFRTVSRAKIGWPWQGRAEIMRFALPQGYSSRSSR